MPLAHFPRKVSMKYRSIVCSLALAFASIQGCGNKEEAPTGATAGKASPPASDVICSFAPSQSLLVTSISGAAGASSAAVLAIAQATGLTIVTHSSGSLILTGAGGYIAGTLGSAIVAPVIVGVGLAVGGTAMTVELLCASKNHPTEVAKVEAAAEEFLRRSQQLLSVKPKALEELKVNAGSLAGKAALEVKRVAGDVFEYAYRLTPSSSTQ